jgi:hypothetical protein
MDEAIAADWADAFAGGEDDDTTAETTDSSGAPMDEDTASAWDAAFEGEDNEDSDAVTAKLDWDEEDEAEPAEIPVTETSTAAGENVADTAAAPATDQDDSDDATATGDNQPGSASFEIPEILRDGAESAGRHKVLLGSILAIMLLVFMVLQAMYFMRDRLLPRYEILRPALQMMCNYTDCVLPLRQDLEHITLIDREVRSHPVNPDALQVTATIMNNAEYAQAYPVIRITLSNRHGRIVASRDFKPADYLSENIDIDKGLAPNQPLHIELEVADPGKDAVGFTFEFL